MKLIEIIDVKRNDAKYTLELSDEDAERTQTDVEFANNLLCHVRVMDKPTTVPETFSQAGTAGTSSPNNITFLKVCNVNENSLTDTVQDGENGHLWTYNETLDLIQSIEFHYEDLNHPSKQKYVFDNIASNLVNNGHSVTGIMCKNKWKNLKRSYRVSKENKNKTGKGPSRFQFFDELDSFLGDNPSNKCDPEVILGVCGDTPNVELRDTKIEEKTENIQLPKRRRKHRNKLHTRMSEQYYKVKLFQIRAKNKRHADRMELEMEKLEVEKRKITLLEQLLANK